MAGENRNAMETVKLVLPLESIGQVKWRRNVPVGMMERRAAEDRNGNNVSIKTKFNQGP